MSTGNTVKVVKRANRTGSIVIFPKLLVMGKGETMRAEKPKTTMSPEAIASVPLRMCFIHFVNAITHKTFKSSTTELSYNVG